MSWKHEEISTYFLYIMFIMKYRLGCINYSQCSVFMSKFYNFFNRLNYSGNIYYSWNSYYFCFVWQLVFKVVNIKLTIFIKVDKLYYSFFLFSNKLPWNNICMVVWYSKYNFIPFIYKFQTIGICNEVDWFGSIFSKNNFFKFFRLCFFAILTTASISVIFNNGLDGVSI